MERAQAMQQRIDDLGGGQTYTSSAAYRLPCGTCKVVDPALNRGSPLEWIRQLAPTVRTWATPEMDRQPSQR
jgi:hypothetical protein